MWSEEKIFSNKNSSNFKIHWILLLKCVTFEECFLENYILLSPLKLTLRSPETLVLYCWFYKLCLKSSIFFFPCNTGADTCALNKAPHCTMYYLCLRLIDHCRTHPWTFWNTWNNTGWGVVILSKASDTVNLVWNMAAILLAPGFGCVCYISAMAFTLD